MGLVVITELDVGWRWFCGVFDAAWTAGLLDWCLMVGRVFVFVRVSPLIFDAPRCWLSPMYLYFIFFLVGLDSGWIVYWVLYALWQKVVHLPPPFFASYSSADDEHFLNFP